MSLESLSEEPATCLLLAAPRLDVRTSGLVFPVAHGSPSQEPLAKHNYMYGNSWNRIAEYYDLVKVEAFVMRKATFLVKSTEPPPPPATDETIGENAPQEEL